MEEENNRTTSIVNAQTDVSDLTAKYVPDIDAVDNGPAYKLQYGALPKAMGVVDKQDESDSTTKEDLDQMAVSYIFKKLD